MVWSMSSDDVEAVTRHKAGGSLALVAGQHLAIETSPAGEEYLDVEVPAGKVWNIRVSVSITETEA